MHLQIKSGGRAIEISPYSLWPISRCEAGCSAWQIILDNLKKVVDRWSGCDHGFQLRKFYLHMHVSGASFLIGKSERDGLDNGSGEAGRHQVEDLK